MLRYLARYTHRVAISNRRLIAVDENGVTFKYKDYRIEGPARYKTMTLAAHEFIRRFLIHVLPAGFHRIRHYGLFASDTRADNIAGTRAARSAYPPSNPDAKAANADEPPCTRASLPVLWRPHDHHRDLRARLNTALSANARTHDQDRHLMMTALRRRNSQYPSSRWSIRHARSLNCTCPTPDYATYASIFIAQTRYLRSQPSAHVRQRRRSIRSIALAAPAHRTDGAQIPIGPRHGRRPTCRDFVPWRFSDAGRAGAAWLRCRHRRPKTLYERELVKAFPHGAYQLGMPRGCAVPLDKHPVSAGENSLAAGATASRP